MYTVWTVWEGEIITADTHATLDAAYNAADDAVRVADATTIERGIYGDTVVQVIDEGDAVLAETIVPGVDHRPILMHAYSDAGNIMGGVLDFTDTAVIVGVADDSAVSAPMVSIVVAADDGHRAAWLTIAEARDVLTAIQSAMARIESSGECDMCGKHKLIALRSSMMTLCESCYLANIERGK